MRHVVLEDMTASGTCLTKLARQADLTPPRNKPCLSLIIHTVAPELSVAKKFLREEQTKCRAYGQREGYNLQALDKGMTPVGPRKQYGRTAPGTQAVFNTIIHCRLQLLVRQGPKNALLSCQRSPAPSCGAQYLVRCSEQHGRPTRSALQKSARPIWETPPQCLPDSPGELERVTGRRS